MTTSHRSLFLTSILILAGIAAPVVAQSGRGFRDNSNRPWMNAALPPDQRADLVIQQMTLDEKIDLVHGAEDYSNYHTPQYSRPLGGAGWVPGISRLGIPDLQMTDGRSGVAHIGQGRYATALPSSLGAAATWDLKLAYDYGALVGKEARELGFNVSLGGTANLIRDPRNGRNFECWGEDPILIGKMLAHDLKGTQDQGIIANINRYAANDEETGRMVYNSIIEKRALRETDLLPFEIAIKQSGVATVMCSYNQLNGMFACENPYLLTDVLKNKWNFNGWIMSDWGATHSAVASALAGLDQEMPGGKYFGDTLETAVQSGDVPMARLDDMVHRILRTAFAIGVIDHQPDAVPVNPFTGAALAQQVAEAGSVLLRNVKGRLPLKASAIKSIAVIGSHADVGVLSGGGSDQVDPAAGNAVIDLAPFARGGRRDIWHPSVPLEAIRSKVPRAKVEYDPGTDPVAAAKLAAASEVAIVFVNQPTTEGRDVENLSLPDNQDQLVSAIAAANPHMIVVLETGGPVTMPWIENVGAVLETWYPGISGAQAIANILFGDANPSGKLPVTFPKTEADLPHPELPGLNLLTAPLPAPPPGPSTPAPAGPGRGGRPAQIPPFDINYSEGLKNGYTWFESEGKSPLFPFGFGLSYTTFGYSQLKVVAGDKVTVTFSLKNTGKLPGAEVAQVYVALPPSAGEPPKRLVAWDKVQLAAGETKSVTLDVEPLLLSIFNTDKDDWELLPGDYKVYVGDSSDSTPLQATVHIAATR
jgi:beta-glucosidase